MIEIVDDVLVLRIAGAEWHISEDGFIVDEVGEVKCPVCGGSMKPHRIACSSSYGRKCSRCNY